jgi:hypothetical protein
MRKNNYLIKVNLTLFLIFVFSVTAIAQAGDSPCHSSRGFCIGSIEDDVVIAPGFVANSKSFSVSNKGNLFVEVSIKTFADNVGTSKYKISLYRGTPNSNPALVSGTEVVSKEELVGRTVKYITFTTNVTCSQTGTYYIRIKNTSTDNPQMGLVTDVYYDYVPLVTQYLDAPPTKFPLSIESGVRSGVAIGTFSKPGKLHLYAKWHVQSIIPTYAKISISLERPNGSPALLIKDYWSLHYKEGSPKFQNITYEITEQDADLSGEWRLKLNNNSTHDIVGFNIQRGNEPNPLVPQFKSYFTNGCG